MISYLKFNWNALSSNAYFRSHILSEGEISFQATIGSLSKQTHISFWRAFSWHTISYFILPWDLLANSFTSHILLPCGISGQAMSRLLSYNSFEIGSLGVQCHSEVSGQTIPYLMVCEIFGQTMSYLTSDICALIGYDAGYLWAGNSTCQISDLILRSDFWSDNVISHIWFWDDLSGQTLSYLTFYFDVRSWRAMWHLISHPMSA